MTSQQRENLLDLKACIERCLLTDSYEECLMRVGQDASGLLLDPNTDRLTKGERDVIIATK